MGRLIAVLGNVASGKTTLSRALSNVFGLETGLEVLETRPFQTAFMQRPQRYALANQLDFLLTRAEQETVIRAAARDGIQDGGLEMDYHVFTRLFARRGYLTSAETALCDRLYAFIRRSLPLPDLVLWLDTPPEIARARFTARARPIDVVRPEDIPQLHALLQQRILVLQEAGVPIWRLDVSAPDPGLQNTLAALQPHLRGWLAGRSAAHQENPPCAL